MPLNRPSRKSKRGLRAIGIAACLFVACAAFFGAAGAESPSTAVKAVVCFDLSTKDAAARKRRLDFVRAIEMHARETSRETSRDGKTPNIELVVRDTRGDPATARRIAESLAGDPAVVAVMGFEYSSSIEACADIFEKAGLPVISPSATNPDVLARYDLVRSMMADDALTAHRMADYAQTVLGAQSIGLISSDSLYGQGLAKEFIDRANRTDLHVSPLFSIKDMENDKGELVDIIQEAQHCGHDGIALLVHSTEAKPIMKILADLDYKGIVLCPDSCTNLPELVPYEQLSALENIYIASPMLFSLANAEAASFRKKLNKSAGDDATPFDAMAYDAFGVVAETLRRGAGTREEVAAALSAMDSPTAAYTGVTGKVFFTPDGSTHRPLFMSIPHGRDLMPAFTQLTEIYDKESALQFLPEKHADIAVVGGVTYFLTQVVWTGLHFTRISGINLPNGTFDAGLLLWFLWEGDVDVENIIIANELDNFEESKTVLRRARRGDVNYICFDIAARCATAYNLSHFPFDDQSLELKVKHRFKDADNLMLAVDNRGISRGLETMEELPKGWEFIHREHYTGAASVRSIFSFPRDIPFEKHSVFSLFNSRIIVKRSFFPSFMKIFLPMFILLTVGFLSLLIPQKQFRTRMAGPGAALLSILVFHMTLLRQHPPATYIVRSDLFFLTAYGLLLCLHLLAIGTHYKYSNGDVASANRLNLVFGALLTLAGVGIYLWLMFMPI